MAESNLHVVTHEEEGWAIKREGSPNPLSTHSTQKDAINAALDVAQDEETNVIVHRRDGRIREVKTFNGNGEDTNSTPVTTPRRQTVSPLASMGSRVRWGAVMAGFLVTLAASLTLTALGVALSLCLTNVMSAESLRIFVGVWVMLTLLASLFAGGLIISRMTVGESDVVEPSVYGVLLWSLTFVVLPLLPLTASNIGFGSFSPSQQQANPALSQEELVSAGLTEEQATTVSQMANPEGTVSSWMGGNAIEVAWLSFAAILISLAAAIGGSLLGAALDEDHLLRQKRTVRTST